MENKPIELTLEFLLPRALLCHEIDQWKISVGKGLQFSIGAKYQTVVRSYERVYDVDMRPECRHSYVPSVKDSARKRGF